MTYITVASKRYVIKFTDHVNELSQKLGYDIADKPFYADEGGADKEGKVRGYVRFPLGNNAMMDKGPITLNVDDLEEYK